MNALPLVLASASPRRRFLLEELGLRFTVAPAGVDESALPRETPEAHVARLAAAKAEVVAAALDGAGALVLAADTTVALDGAILGKPRDASDALAILRTLAGKTHTVWTACRLLRSDQAREAAAAVATRVTFRPWDERLARWYVGTGEPLDKAGAYGLQGRGALLVASIEGSWSNVVGLPMEALPGLFREAGDDLAARLVDRGGRG